MSRALRSRANSEIRRLGEPSRNLTLGRDSGAVGDRERPVKHAPRVGHLRRPATIGATFRSDSGRDSSLANFG